VAFGDAVEPARARRQDSRHLYLGIDCGTQGLKAVAIDGASGAVVATSRRRYGTIAGLPAGFSEQHPRLWTRAACSALREILASPGVDSRGVRALAVSGQQHGLVVLDRRGSVLRPAKLWNDTSAAAEAAALGVPAGFTAPKVLWLKRAEPETLSRCAAVLLPHDYVNFWLTGRKVAEAGDASGTGYFDVRARRYDDRALAAIDPRLASWVPPLVAAGETIGVVRPELARALGLPEDVEVGHGSGDNMMAALGTGNTRPGIVTVSLGTSGTAFAYSPTPVVDPAGEVAPFCDATGGYLPLVCIQSCTEAIELTRKALKLGLGALDAAAASAPPGARGARLLPFFGGERTPDLPEATGALLGLTSQSFSRECIARAAFEGPTLGLAAGLDRLRSLGLPVHEVRLTGGGARSATWRRICADAFGVPVVRLAVEEGAAFGAALCALWCSRRAAGERDPADGVASRLVQLDPRTRVEPDSASHGVYRDLVSLRGELIQDLRPVFARVSART
jgi:xylulokinase